MKLVKGICLPGKWSSTFKINQANYMMTFGINKNIDECIYNQAPTFAGDKGLRTL